MKRTIILCALFLWGCSYGEREDWDSGAAATQQSEMQQQQDTSENVRNQYPTVRPGVENPEPF